MNGNNNDNKSTLTNHSTRTAKDATTNNAATKNPIRNNSDVHTVLNATIKSTDGKYHNLTFNKENKSLELILLRYVYTFFKTTLTFLDQIHHQQSIK